MNKQENETRHLIKLPEYIKFTGLNSIFMAFSMTSKRVTLQISFEMNECAGRWPESEPKF